MELCSMLYDSLDGRGIWERMDACIHVPESLCCLPETITTLVISYACMLILLSQVQRFATSWTVARQAPLSMGFPRQEYWSGLPSPSSGDLPDPGIKPTSPARGGGFFTQEPPGKPWSKENWTFGLSLGNTHQQQPKQLFTVISAS